MSDLLTTTGQADDNTLYLIITQGILTITISGQSGPGPHMVSVPSCYQDMCLTILSLPPVTGVLSHP